MDWLHIFSCKINVFSAPKKMKKVIRIGGRAIGIIRQAQWLLTNAARASRFDEVPETQWNDVYLMPLSKNRLKEFCSIYKKYSGNAKTPRRLRALYYLFGNKLGIIACDRSGVVMGVEIYYINARDRAENTIHQAFTGVTTGARGKGVATAIRSHAKSHFKENGISGVSSRVSLSNKTSLAINVKLGFQPVEKYYDGLLGEGRYYLVCTLDGAEK